jgi:predicted DNA-binding antitoxin AbrB/MazE fold protein
VNYEIDRLLKSSKLSAGNFEKKIKINTEKLFKDWIEQQIKILTSDAQIELTQSIKYIISLQNNNRRTRFQTDYDGSSEKVISVASLITGSVAIPAVATLSTATVSVGGLWGLLGVTTTIISWPVAVVGGVVAVGLLGFGSRKIMKQKVNISEYYKTTIKIKIRKQVLCGKNNQYSICQKMQDEIKDSASEILRELEV